jgi:hypothetical protein
MSAAGGMNPTRLDDLIATRHPKNLMLHGQRRDDSDTPARKDDRVVPSREVDGQKTT